MESSDSDDCIITNFFGGKDEILIVDDGEPLLKKCKIEKDIGAVNLDLEIVPGDGHCISHCFSRHFKEPLSMILKRIKSEFQENIDFYKEFSLSSEEDILHEVNEYVSKNRYNNETTDMFLHAFSRAFRVNVKVFQPNGDILIDGDFDHEIKLSRNGDHYNLYRTGNFEVIPDDINERER